MTRERAKTKKQITQARGHSLWLMPKGDIDDKTRQVIEMLAEAHNAPIIEPHITLLGEAMQPENEVLNRTRRATMNQKPFTITLQRIEYEDVYFRALFVKVDESEELNLLHNKTKKVFGMENIPTYMPHLSLLYGDFPQSKKRAMINTVKDKLGKIEFVIDRILVYRTKGKVHEWYKIGEFPFREK